MEQFFKRAASFLDRTPELWKENIEIVELNRRFLWFLTLRFGVAATMFVLGFTKRIFIIDDDRDMVDSLKMVLEGNGYGTGSAYNASEALDKARNYRPYLIILDVMFPENPSEGFDLARKLHQNESTARIPVLILSAINERFNLGFSEKDRDESWLPVKHFIEKPVVPDKLIALVKEIIGS